jgi:uncharacterized protein (TIGR03089 family)
VRQLTPEQRFSELLAADPARPFVTYYDEASGERSELSVRSLANWVAKTHHLLGTELGLGVGDRALVAVPAHWISVPILLGVLTAGLTLVPDGDAEVAFVAPGVDGDAPDIYAIAPDSAAVGFRGSPPAGTEDYVAAVRPQADAWAGVQLAAGPGDECLPGRSRSEVLDLAVSRAADLGIAAGGRLMSTRTWTGVDDWVDDVLAPLAVGGSVVIVANASDDVLARRAEQERVTARRA